MDDLAGMGIEVKTTKYAGKVDDLSGEHYENLKKSIADNGLFYPITINQNGDVLDGHHRLKACQELGIPPQISVIAKPFESEAREELFVIDSNLARRQLTTLQACELALKKKTILARIAEEQMKAGVTLSRNQERVHVDEQLAKQAGTSKDTFYKAELLLQAEQEDPEGYAAKLAEDARDNKISVNKAYRKLRKAQARIKKAAELAESAEKRRATVLPDYVTLLNRDMREDEEGPIAELEDNSIDLIITDPPYTTDMLHLFEALADFAARKLKPGGSVVFYFGQLNEPEIHMIFYK